MPSPRPPGIGAPLSDVLAVAIVVLFALLPYPDGDFRVGGPLLVLATLPAAAMPFRRRAPLGVLAASVTCAIVLALTGVLAPGALIAVAISAFAVADRMPRRIAIACVSAAAAAVFAGSAAALGGELFDSRALEFVLFVLLAGALGDAARSRRDYALALRERAERAERGRDEEARRRVAEERVRIARDLHDIVAHQISVISLNAGVASSSLESHPEHARTALATIRAASRAVLADIGGLMTMLREDDADGAAAEPRGGLHRAQEVVDRFARVGLRVDLDLDLPSGAAGLSPASDHVAYLALVEGLTNAHKHGSGGSATARIRAAGDVLRVTVVNPVGVGVGETPSTGFGLRGLRERAVPVRGRVQTTRTAEEFVLDVALPLERRA